MPYYHEVRNTKWELHATEEELVSWMDSGFVSEEGIIYYSELSGPGGADYYFFPASWHTKEDVRMTREWASHSFDVTGIHMGVPDSDGDDYPVPKEIPMWTPEQREAAFRKIIDEGAMGMVEDCIAVDSFTASAVVAVMDGIKPKHKEAFLSRPASIMIDMTWKVLENTK